MRTPSLPPDETERLATLQDYGLLDTPPEPVLAGIVELAASICGTESAAITLIDRDRQWFKAERGLGLAETSRGESICGHAILSEHFFEVPDTRADERFIGNELLERTPGIRFYGGSQLRAPSGHALGMLCVLDSKPQQLSASQRESLDHLAKVVMGLFDAWRERRTVEWLGRAVDSVGDEVLIVDAEHLRYLYANAAARSNLGYAMDELRRLTPMDLTAGLTRETFLGYVERLKSGAAQVVFEGLRRRRDGSQYLGEVRAHLLQSSGRAVVVSLVHDITQRRAVENLKDEFISVVNHELRTPLTAIHGAIKLLEHGAAGALPAQAAQLVKLAALNTAQLKHIVDDILDLEKIASGGMEFTCAPVSARTALQELGAAHAPAAQIGRVRLHIAAPEQLHLQADAQRLRQVLSNLLSNALKYAPADTSIELAAQDEGQHVRLSVTDHGPGVPEHFRDRIFQRFAQARMDNSRDKGGSGLGLAIVKQMVEQMGGTVGYDSRPGHTVFHVRMPKAEAA